MRLVRKPVRHQAYALRAPALELAGHLLQEVEPKRRLAESAEDDFFKAGRVAHGGENLACVGFCLSESQVLALVDAIAQKTAEKNTNSGNRS